MGLITKSNRNEKGPLNLKINDLDYTFSFDNIEKVNLSDESLILLKNMKNSFLIKTKKKIKAGDFEVKTDEKWIKAFDKLVEYKLINKIDEEYVLTNKGYEYIK